MNENVYIISQYNRNDIYYLLKPPFSPYPKFQTGVHTSLYMDNIQWIIVKGVKLPYINCHNGYGCVLYRWPIGFVPNVGRICCALTPDFSVSVGGRFLLRNTSRRIPREEVCDSSGWRHLLRQRSDKRIGWLFSRQLLLPCSSNIVHLGPAAFSVGHIAGRNQWEIGGNLKGIDKTADIPVPTVDPLFLGFQAQCIHSPLVDTDKIIVRIPFAKFSTVFQLIITELIIFSQKSFQWE